MDATGVVSEAERERRQQEAVSKGLTQGVTSALLAAGCLGGAHVLLNQLVPAYRSVKVYPKRIVGAVLVAATFAYQSQRTAGELAQHYGDIDGAAIAAADEVHAEEKRQQLRRARQ